MTSTIRVGALAFIGLLLLQTAWILAVPPFHGIDEFDHVYRAAGVADGQWRLTTPAQDARGQLVTVPRELVEAASPQCDALPYTDPGNCHPIDEVAPGVVTVATAAGAYNPLYYAVIGVPAGAFAGAGADYAMRILSAAVCSLGIAVSIALLHGTQAGSWMRFGLLVALTPVLVYSTILPAPNAIETVAALCVWTALLSLDGPNCGARARHALLTVAAGGASVLAVVRLLGPMWLGLIVLGVAGVLGFRRVIALVLRDPFGWIVSSVIVVAALGYGLWWTVSVGLTSPSDAPLTTEPWRVKTWIAQSVVWMAQAVGAFPFRDQPAPTGVYALYFLVLVALLAGGFARSAASGWRMLSLLVVATIVLPIILTCLTYPERAVIWQGRYGLPFTVGVPIVAGLMIDRSSTAFRHADLCRLAGVGMLGAAHVWSVLSVLSSESQRAQHVLTPGWATVPSVVLLLIAASGFSVLAVAAWMPSGRVPMNGSRGFGEWGALTHRA